jgi:hypothetical protein
LQNGKDDDRRMRDYPMHGLLSLQWFNCWRLGVRAYPFTSPCLTVIISIVA